VDADAYDELVGELGEDAVGGERPSGAFEYESAEASFEPEKLGGVARVMFDALRAAGATGFRVHYDGGYDEGFSHPDAVLFANGELRAAGDVVASIASPALVAQIRAAAAKGSMWGDTTTMYERSTEAEAVAYALDELSGELAVKLLGEGFGTGEYQLYGAFTADFATGRIVDHEDAPKPPEMD
jgi:hypothetical protein